MSLFSFYRTVGLATSLVLVTGCGGAQPEPDPFPRPVPDHIHHEGGTEHEASHDMKVHPTLDEFHAFFAPIWHTEEDSERAKKACNHAKNIHGLVKKIEEGPIPEKAKDQEAWKADGPELMIQADGLLNDCKVGPEPVLPRLKNIHEGFHKLLDRAVGKLDK